MLEKTNTAEISAVFDLTDQAATIKLGGLIAPALALGDVVALDGELGTGKTVLARAIIQSLARAEETPSPTFTLVQTYPATIRGKDTEIWHFDLYRLKLPEEAYDLAIEDAFGDGISIIEWPSRLGHLLPRDCLWVRLAITGEHRRRAVISGGERWRSLIRGIEKEWRS